MPRSRILVPLAQGFEETEAVATADVLSRAGVQPVLAHFPGAAPLVTGSHGFSLEASCSLADMSPDGFTGIFLPGGTPGTKNLRESREVRDLLVGFHQRGKLIAAICAAPTVLYHAGLLTGRRVTSHPSLVSLFAGCSYEDSPVVVDSPFITSRGPGTALLCGLTIVACLRGPKAADDLAAAMVASIPEGLRMEWDRWGLTS